MQTQTASAGATLQTAGSRAGEPVAPTRPIGPAGRLSLAAKIARWLPSRQAGGFPYDAVVTEFHRIGKHLVATELLEALAGVRAALPEMRGPASSLRLLDQFLHNALDKYDARYANPTYLGLSLLPLSELDDPNRDLAAVERQYDRLLVQLVADAMRFEVAAVEGATAFLPELRPDARTTAKRCRLGLQIAGPAARRLGLADGVDLDEPITGARRLWANLAATHIRAERRTLQLSMLPVSLVHDEYQFIRVLQAFEATFALVAVQVQEAVLALAGGKARQATRSILAAATVLHEAAPLFSLVGTMQLEAFQTFRVFTEGASAIQSRNYKLVESLCRQPDSTRLDSVAYHAVPDVRQRVLAGQATLDEAFAAARAAGRLRPDDADCLARAMQQLAATLLRWRRTHYRIAVKMLGERTGTGYTEGAAYLKSVEEIPVFTTLAAEGSEKSVAGDGGVTPTKPAIPAAHGGCPFAAGRIPLERAMAFDDTGD